MEVTIAKMAPQSLEEFEGIVLEGRDGYNGVQQVVA
jgi:hypothetical protein